MIFSSESQNLDDDGALVLAEEMRLVHAARQAIANRALEDRGPRQIHVARFFDDGPVKGLFQPKAIVSAGKDAKKHGFMRNVHDLRSPL